AWRARSPRARARCRRPRQDLGRRRTSRQALGMVRAVRFKCPWGHQSTNEAYCDFCGALNPLAPPVAERRTNRPAGGVALAAQPCGACGTIRDGTDRYCVNCGYDFEVGAGLAAGEPTGWADPP